MFSCYFPSFVFWFINSCGFKHTIGQARHVLWRQPENQTLKDIQNPPMSTDSWWEQIHFLRKNRVSERLMLILSSVQNYVFDHTFHTSPLPEHLRNCMHSFKPYPTPSPHAHTQWRQTGTFRNLVSKHTTSVFSSEMGKDSSGCCARGKRVGVVFMCVWLCACGYKGRLLNAGFGPRANRKSFITRSKSHLNTSHVLE